MMGILQQHVGSFGGSINKVLVDDKGTLAVVVFGLPGEVKEDSPLRGVCALLAVQHDLANVGMACFAGLTTAATSAEIKFKFLSSAT